MSGLHLLCVLGLFAAFAHSFTDVCDVANTAVLFDQTFKVYEARLQCEMSSFSGPHCSSYYLNAQKLLRSDLSFKKCVARHAAPYFVYGGMPSHPETGVFFLEQDKLSLFNNQTWAQLRHDIDEEFTALLARVNFLWGSTRTNMSALITTQWTDTRTLGSQEEQNNRQNASLEYQQTREFDSTSESNNRATSASENGATREFDMDTEANIRALVDSTQSDENAQWSTETQNTIANVSGGSSASKQAFKANIRAEQTNNRASSASETAATRSTQTSYTSQTLSLIQQYSDSTTSTYNTQQASVNSGWASLVSTASSLLSTFSGKQDSSEDKLTDLLMHIQLQSNAWVNSWGCIGINEFGPVDAFQRPAMFTRFRAIVNDTIVYNRGMYGNDASANLLWYQGEAAKNDRDYRSAAVYYSQAYIKATTPGYW